MALRVPLPAHDADNGADGPERADSVVFEDLWQHRSALRDICQRIVGDAATADDVVQETYIRALRNLDRLEQRPSLMPWLATVARRRSIDELRRRQYQRPVDAMPDESTKPEFDPGEAAGVSETVTKVREALTGLTERERELLTRQVNHGLSLAELADFDNSSIASVRSVLSRARNKLRDALEEAGSRVLAPVGLVGGWMKHRLGLVNSRAQRLSPVLPGGYERVGEMATAVVAAAAIAVGGGLVPALSGTGEGGSGPSAVTAAAAPTAGGDDLLGFGGFDGSGASGLVANDPEPSSSLHRASVVDANTPSPEGNGATPSGPKADITTPAPLPDTGERSVPTPDPDYFTKQSDPAGPEETHVHQLVAPAPAQGSPDSYQPVFGLSTAPCGPNPCEILWYSADGGHTWSERKGEGLEDATSIMVPQGFSVERDTLYATGPAGLLASYDGGDHFAQVFTTPNPGPVAVSPGYWSGDQSVYLGGTPHARYDEATRVAVPVAAGLPAQVAHFAFAADFPGTDVMFAGTTNVGEEDWVAAVYSCRDEVCLEAVEFDNVSEAPHVAVPSFSRNGAVVFAWAGNKVFRSLDGGASFSAVPLGVPGHVRGLADDGEAIYLAVEHIAGTNSSGAILRSVDRGATWTTLGAGTALSTGVDSVTALADGTILAGADDGGVLCSQDDGATWAARCE